MKWHVEHLLGLGYVITDAENTFICVLKDKEKAGLMAAAPELLKACEMAKQLLDALRIESDIGAHLMDSERQVFENVGKQLVDVIDAAEGGGDEVAH